MARAAQLSIGKVRMPPGHLVPVWAKSSSKASPRKKLDPRSRSRLAADERRSSACAVAIVVYGHPVSLPPTPYTSTEHACNRSAGSRREHDAHRDGRTASVVLRALARTVQGRSPEGRSIRGSGREVSADHAGEPIPTIAPADWAIASGGSMPMKTLPLRVLLAAALFAAAPPPRAVAAQSAADQVLRATLDNGLRVVIVRNTLAPVVTTAVNYLVGSNEAPSGFPGMAHAQEHMMFRGASALSAAQLSYLSAAMGGEFDASTQQTLTQYVFTMAAEDFDVALRIEAIRMRGVTDGEQAWRQERGAIEQEIAQDLSNPQYLLYSKLLAALFAGTPYAHDALGTKASFDRTTGAMLKRFADTWYAPNNAILVVVGDIDPAAALARVKAHFGGLRPRRLPRRPPVVLQPVRPRTLALPTDLPYGLAVLAFRAPGFADADYAAMRVLSDVLSSQRG